MKMRLQAGLLWIAAWLCAAPALAHDVQAVLSEGPPRQVTLAYGDGEPFAYEAYELRAPGAALSDAPLQSGRTSEHGVIPLDALQSMRQPLRLRAFSSDGHGVDMLLAAAGTAPPAARAGERMMRGAAGLLVIAALYGLWLAARRWRRARTAAAAQN